MRAHREGILTTASLMVNEPACDEAVALARENPRLGVGLHLTLLCGRSALPPDKIPGLVNAEGEFEQSTRRQWVFVISADRSLHAQLREEIHAQFQRFHATGLTLDHVNGHLHMHMHPTVFRIFMEEAAAFGIRHLRLTRDPFLAERPAGVGPMALSRQPCVDLSLPLRTRAAPIRSAGHSPHAAGLRTAAKCARG